MVSYDEHKEWLRRLLDGLTAEYHGFIRAECGNIVPWSPDPVLQDRFERGYRDGQVKLAQDAHLTEEGEEV